MNKNEKMLMQESLHFIGKNLNVYTNQIPRHLRQFWKLEDSIREDDVEFEVFISALVLYKFSKTGSTTIRFTEEDLVKLFNQWQDILSAEELNETTDIKIAPLKLFDFDNYDSMELNVSLKEDWLESSPYAKAFRNKKNNQELETLMNTP